MEQFFIVFNIYYYGFMHTFYLSFFSCTCRNIFTVNVRRGLTEMLRTCCEHTQPLSLERSTFAYRYVFVVEENFFGVNFLCYEVTVTKIVTTQCVGYS